jgi:hypothetical protein
MKFGNILNRKWFIAGLMVVMITVFTIGIVTGSTMGHYVLSNTAHIKMKIKLFQAFWELITLI